MQILKQPQYKPVPVEQQVMVIYAIVNKSMTDVETKDIPKFEVALLDFLALNYPEIGSSIAELGEMTSENEEKLKKAITEFKASFVVE